MNDRFETFNCAFRPGDRVKIGVAICATVEEVIMARGMRAPMYLVEYWHEGHLVARRMHEDDLENAAPPKHGAGGIVWRQGRPE